MVERERGRSSALRITSRTSGMIVRVSSRDEISPVSKVGPGSPDDRCPDQKLSCAVRRKSGSFESPRVSSPATRHRASSEDTISVIHTGAWSRPRSARQHPPLAVVVERTVDDHHLDAGADEGANEPRVGGAGQVPPIVQRCVRQAADHEEHLVEPDHGDGVVGGSDLVGQARSERALPRGDGTVQHDEHGATLLRITEDGKRRSGTWERTT